MIRLRVLVALLLLTTVTTVTTVASIAAPVSTPPPAETPQAAIAAQAAAFVEAFHRGDAKALGALWAQDADYIDLDGRVLRGRDSIVAAYETLFRESPGLKLRIETHALRFPSSDVAIEDGVTSVTGPDGTLPNRARYVSTLVKRDGAWLLSSVRESPYLPPSNAEHLRGLAWTFGEWIEERSDEGPRAHVAVFPIADENFIIVERGVVVGGTLLHAGTERIGWDPAETRVRSWSFESDGGFGEGSWSHEPSGQGDRWTVRSTSVLSSGSRMQATSVLSRVDPETLRWQVTKHSVDGMALPDSPIVTMKRVP